MSLEKLKGQIIKYKEDCNKKWKELIVMPHLIIIRNI